MNEGKAKLYAKIATISGNMTRIRKSGTMQGQGNYKYVTDTEIVEAVREEMAKVNLACIPSIVAYQQMQETTKNGGSTMRTICEFVIILACGDTGETIESHWFNEALDSSDKGFNKTATAAMKYFFMKTFQITTGEPDIHESENVQVGRKKQPTPPPHIDGATGEIKADNPATPKYTQVQPATELDRNKVVAKAGDLFKSSSQERFNAFNVMQGENAFADVTTIEVAAEMVAARVKNHSAPKPRANGKPLGMVVDSGADSGAYEDMEF